MRYLHLPFILIYLMLSVAALAAADWHLALQDKKRDIRVYTREISDSPYRSFYAITRTAAHPQTVLAVLSDVAAMPEWIARLRQTRVIKRHGNTDIWVHNIYKLPYPFHDREAVLHSKLTRYQNGTVEIVTTAEEGMVPSSHNVRLLNIKSTWRITTESKDSVKIEWWGQGDPGGYMLPAIFNYSLANEPARALKFLHQMLQRPKYQTSSAHKPLPAQDGLPEACSNC